MNLLDSEEGFNEAERQFRNQYDITEVLGEGTYGKVRKARCRHTGELRALKQMKIGNREDGVPSTAIREIAILKELTLVFELMDSDLKKPMKALGGRLTPKQVRDF